MKRIEDEPENTIESIGKDAGAVKESGPGSGDVGGSEADTKGVVKRPQGSSVTLYGSGDRSGRDKDNSMSLSDAYRVILRRRDGEARP